MQTFQRLLLKQFENATYGTETDVRTEKFALTIPVSATRRRVYLGFAWDTLTATAPSLFCQAKIVLRDGEGNEIATFGWSYAGTRLTNPTLDPERDMCVPSFAVELLPADLGDTFPTTTPGTPDEMVAVALNAGTETRTIFRMQPMTVLSNSNELEIEVAFTVGVFEAGVFQIAFGVRADAP